DESDTAAARPARTNIPGLKDITATNYPGFVLSVADTTRAGLFGDSVASWDRQGRFPDLTILWLPRDHTLGRQASRPTPRAMVAEKDLALGLIVQRLSESPAWPSLAAFVLEDDAQNGPDHVDAHRSVLLVASPYARGDAVDSTFSRPRPSCAPLRRSSASRHSASTTPQPRLCGAPSCGARTRRRSRIYRARGPSPNSTPAPSAPGSPSVTWPRRMKRTRWS